MTNKEEKAALIRLMSKNVAARIMWLISKVGLLAVGLWLVYAGLTDLVEPVGFFIILGTLMAASGICGSQYDKLATMFKKYQEHMEKVNG